MSGYYAEFGALHREARVYDELERHAEEVRDELRAAFDRDRNTLGDDAYGAELARKLPGIERGIFDALKAHLDELERVASGLGASARTYEAPERPHAGRG
ncbi:hypothetical protein FH608_006075 [Nonomuraea phyllanthi]|uniref:Uncharacterized protein n=1 Tax=Nonomuraea phyllanthi TaxID=2219224 RepID=A0A5C4WTW5_9ACTN|nr:hypothetical protein [Nonomuraea phyllanthi]KAB8196327.1 hypothetical protein FH608_006075 [Nonomuraea phyllanthi]QFY05375.1 hypothetical protein GBF35_00570 [Nonomuraea phyllanthi]